LKLLGYERAGIARLRFTSLLSEDQMPKDLEALEELRATGQQKEGTVFRLWRKDGTALLVETKACVLRSGGKPYAIQGIARDVTERKRRNIRMLAEFDSPG
jgi:PAS domain S-box-containing protein